MGERPLSLNKAAETLGMLETVEKDHGRLEISRYSQSTELSWFADLHKWEKLKSVGMVESMREDNGKTTVERRYYLISLELNVDRCVCPGILD